MTAVSRGEMILQVTSAGTGQLTELTLRMLNVSPKWSSITDTIGNILSL